jgi:hypothetical protein
MTKKVVRKQMAGTSTRQHRFPIQSQSLCHQGLTQIYSLLRKTSPSRPIEDLDHIGGKALYLDEEV